MYTVIRSQVESSPISWLYFAGSIVNGRLIFGLCDHVIEWKSVPKVEKRNIRDNLEEIDTICNSKCDVISCLWSDCVPKVGLSIEILLYYCYAKQ